MDWVHEYVPGQVRASCSICGVSRRFPDGLTYCIDKLFRCERCMETTAMELDMQIQSYRMQPDEVSQSVGLTPQGELPSTFLADAAEYRASVLPGWTPSSQFYDDFTIVPGGVGSSWTVTASGSGAVSLPEAGVARFDSPGPTGNVFATVASVSVPDPSAGRFFMACRAKISINTGTGLARAGAGTSGGSFTTVAGANSTGAQFYSVSALARTDTTLEIDETAYSVMRVWWNTGGSVFGSVDSSPSVSTRSSFSAARLPYIVAQNTAARIDISDYVCWV